jgi:hypothetical protein
MFNLFLMLVIFTVVGASTINTKYSKDDHRLLQYYEKFKVDAKIFGKELPDKNFTIWFGNTKNLYYPTRIGYCHFKEEREIVIDRRWFDRATEEQRELVLYHEFGHCVLNLNHNNECAVVKNNKCVLPASLMNQSVNWRGYFKNRDYFLGELFSSKNYIKINNYIYEQE